MARPNKYNLQYFPLDVNFFDDDKMILIEEDFGFKGGYVAVRLMAMVYEQGYYMEWKPTSQFTISKRVGKGITGALVMDILRSCLKHGLFNEELFNVHAVLTSKGIQERWSLVMSQLRRKIEVSSTFWLVNAIDSIVSSEETIAPVTFSTQKESKVNESKLKEKKSIGASPPTKRIFIPPVLKEVQDYFFELMGNSKKTNPWPVDKCSNEGSTFMDHYIANGWVQSRGKKIVDWKAACRNWIRNDLKGSFSHQNKKAFEEKVIIQKPPPEISRVQVEINYLFERFTEDEKNVTIISINPEHYNFLKTKGLIEFSDAEINEISKNAKVALNGNCNDKALINMMKRIGVLEYFKKMNNEKKVS